MHSKSCPGRKKCRKQKNLTRYPLLRWRLDFCMEDTWWAWHFHRRAVLHAITVFQIRHYNFGYLLEDKRNNRDDISQRLNVIIMGHFILHKYVGFPYTENSYIEIPKMLAVTELRLIDTPDSHWINRLLKKNLLKIKEVLQLLTSCIRLRTYIKVTCIDNILSLLPTHLAFCL